MGIRKRQAFHLRREIFYELRYSFPEIVKEVRRLDREIPFRPCLDIVGAQDYITSCIKACWNEDQEQRPDIRYVRVRLKEMQVWRGKPSKLAIKTLFSRLD